MGRSNAGDTESVFYLGGKGSCKGKAKPYNTWRYTFTIWRLALSPSLWRVWGLHKQVECSKNNSNDSLKIDFKKKSFDNINSQHKFNKKMETFFVIPSCKIFNCQ